MTDIPACPDCVQGKHQNCDGGSWDNINDRPTICPCWKNNHQKESR